VSEIEIPYNWEPRDYQLPLFQAMESGVKRAACIWHRRAGKDLAALAYTTVAAMERVGIYWHLLPTLAQGRKVIWQGQTNDGRKFLDLWPKGLVTKVRNDEMRLELANGSSWQVVGSDNYDSLVGSNPIGVVMSEYSIALPAAWDFISPILAANGGWAMFLYTPRGRNHAWDLYDMARHNPEWFDTLLTVEDTDAIDMSVIDEERASGRDEALIQQEYYCSFEAPRQGAYYAEQMMACDNENRIGAVAYDPHVPVETWWDLGIADSTVMWFAQRVGKEIHLIDYYEASGEPLDHYVKAIQGRGYVYSDHVLPHDVKARELISGKTREEVLRKLGIKPSVVKGHLVQDRIEATRAMLSRCWFDRDKCQKGIEALRAYRHEWDERNEVYKARPLHDWASHGADAFGYGAMHAVTEAPNWKPLEYSNKGIR
jgi:hypothetical protein